MLKESIPLKPNKRLQILKCVMCKYRVECNILTEFHLKDNLSIEYFNKLIQSEVN